MKKSEKISAVSGICLLVIAALFLVALLTQLLPFGNAKSAPVLGGIGGLLFGAYGYSSLLIPVFFFAAGLGCFLFPWSERIGVIYALSFIPFFTIVICEKVCGGMLALGSSPLVGIQVAAVIIVCILLLGIEYFAASFVGGLVQNKLREGGARPLEPEPAPHPPIFPEGIIRDDIEELPEKEESPAEEEAPKAETAGNDAAPMLRQEKLSVAAAENAPVQNLYAKEIPSKESLREQEAAPPVEIELPVEDELDSDVDLEATMAIENAYVEDEPPVYQPVPQPEPQVVAAPIPLREEPPVDPLWEQVHSSFHGMEVPPKDEFQPECESAAQQEPEPEPEPEAEAEQETESEPPLLEDVFGEDFFATAPVPTEDVFSKEYIEEFQQRHKPRKEEQAKETTPPEDTAALESQPNDAAGSPPENLDAAAIQPDAGQEEPVSVHFQPIPEYSLEPDPNYNQGIQVDFTSEDMENPSEAAFFEDPFGEKHLPADDSAAPQEKDEMGLDEDSERDDELEDVAAASFQPAEGAAKTHDFPDDCAGSREVHVLDDPALRQPLAEEDSGLDGDFFADDDDLDPDADLAPEQEVSEEDFSAQTDLLTEPDEFDETELAPELDETEFDDVELDDSDEGMGLDEDSEREDELEEEPDGDDEVGLDEDESLDELENEIADESELESGETEEVSPPEILPVRQPLVERAVPQRARGPYKVPAGELLTSYPDGEYWVIDEETVAASQQLKSTLSEFKIEAEVTGIRKGPVITMFEILPAPGVKLSKIVALQDNIALRLAASSVRIVAPIPGKHAVGIEVPNKERAIVSFKELIDTDHPSFRKQAVPVVLGKDITGEAQIMDLAKTPHLLIAGSTGSGKSVCVNSLILSILFKRSPQEVRMILIDPKIVELKLYNDIPHLLTPVITEPKKAFQALQYCLCEMERRYALLDGMGVREITSYNKRIVERNIATEKLPYIVVIIDEFADLMATTGKELESTVARLAAMSRAVGIHLVLATQRPSIDVITGLIKANIPSRIAFMVASKMDSRIIIDQVGAEKLLGKGDMLYASATDPFPVRIQGTFVSDNEVENVVEFVKQYGEPDYIDDEIFVDDEDADMGPSLFGEGDDPLYDQAVEIVLQAGKASASYIQRRLKIGYNRAARLVEEMEEKGIVGPANGSKPREIIQMP